ncbi:molybdate ABC transporter permease subunit [Mycobacterium tuberculosis]|uniref:molybdate ABC transporter permease subunit n=1 Tax=Mycobacterium tuberculosis TaxID=1773 RepID=UPI0027121BDE|nr:hypothetical protein [Mycobacterium tuberculosis]
MIYSMPFVVQPLQNAFSAIGAVVALPLVLPPTVIGFYLLLAMGPNGYVGQFTQWLGLGTLTFSFAGLVIGSVIYSMPFVVQPLQNAFSAIGLDHGPELVRNHTHSRHRPILAGQ